MLANANELPPDHRITCDLCIAGAGAAGISLALQWIDRGLDVCLLEGGGTRFDADSQDLYRGKVEPPLDAPYLHSSRLRFLGGTTNHWLGFCRPLDEIDFAHRPWIPHSGWPIARADLDPYYPRACELCEVPGDFGPPVPLHDAPDCGASVVPLFYGPPTRFGEAYRKALKTASNIRLVLHANVLRLALDSTGHRVGHLEVARDDGQRFQVAARAFVLALGGVENSRLLLLSDDVHPRGVGNGRDQVGRYFMDHPVYSIGTVTSGVKDSPLTQPLERSKREVQTCRLDDRVQEAHRLANCSLGLDVLRHEEDVRADALHDADLEAAAAFFETHCRDAFLAAHGPDRVAEDRAFFTRQRRLARPKGLKVNYFDIRPEPVPHPDSRITLGEATDRFGLRRAVLDWRLADEDAHTLRHSARLLALELGRSGLGRLRLDSLGPLTASYRPGFHHIGGTRMSASPDTGVVDRDAKVFGVDNLFLAGSSIFPTAGYANPTLTLVALALRLAEHLDKRLRAGLE